MRTFLAASASLALLLGASVSAIADECPGNPNAIGTSRTLTVKPSDFPMVGKEQYNETLRLRPREVVLTFDDGPVPPYTGKVLETLAAECTKATFFVLGTNVAEAPDLVRRMVKEGHTVGTHTFSHESLGKMPHEAAMKEIEKGIEVANEALGDPSKVAPFFRAPYLDITTQIQRELYQRGLMIWSIDVESDDWTEITEEQMVELVMQRLAKAGKGIILMHDIQPLTARALPMLLAELKRQNYKIVHVVPAQPAPAKSSSLAPAAGAPRRN
ncbi:MAG: polysaccharide deacetylase family protein [Bradyrhizobiaceae bacterium]|nr:polysaccharide deacetylase family protein [Bradyrhizobiaceae bacterium]